MVEGGVLSLIRPSSTYGRTPFALLLFVIRARMVISPGLLAATLTLFRLASYPKLSFHIPAMHVLWHFRTPTVEPRAGGQAEHLSPWLCAPPSLLTNAVALQTFILEISTPLGNILASRRRFEGGCPNCHTRARPDVRQGSPSTGFKYYALLHGFARMHKVDL